MTANYKIIDNLDSVADGSYFCRVEAYNNYSILEEFYILLPDGRLNIDMQEEIKEYALQKAKNIIQTNNLMQNKPIDYRIQEMLGVKVYFTRKGDN